MRHIEPYSFTVRTLCNPCIYNRAIFRTLVHLEPQTSSKACRTRKMIRHMQNLGIIRTVYSIIFKGIYEQSGILMHICPHSQVPNQGRVGGLPYRFLKIEKSSLIMEKKASLYPSLGQEKKRQNISLWGLFFLCFWRNVYQVPQLHETFPTLKHFWLRACISDCSFCKTPHLKCLTVF